MNAHEIMRRVPRWMLAIGVTWFLLGSVVAVGKPWAPSAVTAE